MAFWLRAGLVIGAIYYLSPLRFGDAPGPASAPAAQARATQEAGRQEAGRLESLPHEPATTAATALGGIVGPAIDALPAALRHRMAEAAAAEAGRALGAGLRTAVTEAGRPASRDTLTVHDRQPAWRGTSEREAR